MSDPALQVIKTWFDNLEQQARQEGEGFAVTERLARAASDCADLLEKDGKDHRELVSELIAVSAQALGWALLERAKKEGGEPFIAEHIARAASTYAAAIGAITGLEITAVTKMVRVPDSPKEAVH